MPDFNVPNGSYISNFTERHEDEILPHTVKDVFTKINLINLKTKKRSTIIEKVTCKTQLKAPMECVTLPPKF